MPETDRSLGTRRTSSSRRTDGAVGIQTHSPSPTDTHIIGPFRYPKCMFLWIFTEDTNFAPRWRQVVWCLLLLGMLMECLLQIPNIPQLLSLLIHRDPSNVLLRDALCNRGFSIEVASRASRPQRESTPAIQRVQVKKII